MADLIEAMGPARPRPREHSRGLQRALRPLTLLFLAAAPSPLQGIPAFARRYQTSCSTCHVVIPKLNRFGQAFRNRGYRFPQGDELYAKVKDVSLGAPEWKDLWPRDLWPGAIPGLPPLSLRFKMDAEVNPSRAEGVEFRFPAEVELLAGGTLGEGLSTFGEVALKDGQLELERVFFQFTGLRGTSLLNLTIGRFEIRAVPFSRFHRRLTSSQFLTSEYRPTPASPRLSEAREGIEVWGARSGREGGLEYAGGWVDGEGSGGIATATDLYYRVSYKFGGYGVAGPRPGDQAGGLESPERWQDNSIRAGTFGYRGSGDSGSREGALWRVGVDWDWYWRDLNLFGLLMRGEDRLTGPEERRAFTGGMVEAEYLVVPGVILLLRYEQIGQDGLDLERWVPGTVLALRANVRFVYESEIFRRASGDSRSRLRMDLAF